MEIRDKRTDETLDFSAVKAGEVFEHGCKFYMRARHGDTGMNLVSGESKSFRPEEQVVEVKDAHMVISH